MNNDSLLITPREKDVLHLLAKGHTYREMAVYLNITTETVKKHLKNIYRKLKVGNKIGALNKVRGL